MKINKYSLAIIGIACIKIAAPQGVHADELSDAFGKCADALKGSCPGIPDYYTIKEQFPSIEYYFDEVYNKQEPACKPYSTVVRYCLLPVSDGRAADIEGCTETWLPALAKQFPKSDTFKFGGACNVTSMFMDSQARTRYLNKTRQIKAEMSAQQAEMSSKGAAMKAKMAAQFANMKENMHFGG